ncbi:MAG: DUF5615 family PIN-like protein [Chloroflexi bacterium]|nr:DUF5615 family PIN-like protein [Chloroflexota bacterium]
MKFLIGNSISPVVAAGLSQAGHDAVHLRDYGIASVSDDAVIERALAEQRTVVTYDLDFGIRWLKPQPLWMTCQRSAMT